MPLTSVRASFHQGCAFRFGNNAGYQCTAIALAALIFASFHHVSEWNSSTLDSILMYGDVLYTSVVHSNYAGQQVYLMPADLPRQTECSGCRMSISYLLDELHGTTSQFTGSDDEMQQSSSFLATPFDSALIAAFSTSDFSLLTIGQLTFAVFHDPIHNTYHMYDSHSRDAFGRMCEQGSAVLLNFYNLQELLHFILATYPNQMFNLTQFLLRLTKVNPVLSSIPFHTAHAPDMQTIQRLHYLITMHL